MCIETIKNILGLTEIGKPNDTQEITGNEIMQLIAANIGVLPNIKLFDKEYKTTTLGEYDRFIQYSQVDLITYESEYHDCDDFAIALWGEFTQNKHWSGLAFGEISAKNTKTGVYHAFNFFITNDGTMYYLEPQNDKIWLAKDDTEWEPYFMMI